MIRLIYSMEDFFRLLFFVRHQTDATLIVSTQPLIAVDVQTNYFAEETKKK